MGVMSPVFCQAFFFWKNSILKREYIYTANYETCMANMIYISVRVIDETNADNCISNYHTQSGMT